MAHFGETIRRLRERMELSQEELAALAKTSRATIQNVEKAKDRKVRGSTYRRVAAALGLTVEALDREAASDTVTIVLPRAMYDSIMERVAYEGHKDILDFLGKVAVTHSFVIEMPEPPAPGTNRLNSPAPATPGPGGTAAARRRPTKARG